MRVFLAGATGAIGRPLLRMLLEEGHSITGMTRSAEKAEGLRAAGADAVVCDAYDADGVRDAVADARPEVVLHELTDIPPDLDLRRYGQQMAGNDRLRREATPVLVRAAVEAGARRVVAQSVAFAYGPGGPPAPTEEAPLDVDAPEPWRRSVAALLVLEETVTRTPGIEGVVLRYGAFYGPGTAYAPDGGIAKQVWARRFPILGKGDGLVSFIHVEDAARATVLTCDHGGPGVYNVVDDDPAPLGDWLPAYARALGARAPFRVPMWLGRLAGGAVVGRFASGRAASNAKARRELGWEPRYPSWRQGFREALG